VTFPDWGGPNLWFGTWELEAAKRGTLLRFAESSLGRIGDTLMDEKAKGWRFLFDGALKAFVEGRPAPVWAEVAGP
jgi:hypothetical protein